MIKQHRKQAGIKAAIALVLVGAFAAGTWATAGTETEDGGSMPVGHRSQSAPWPVTFEANQGQAPPAARYVVRTPGATALLEATGVRWTLAAAPTDDAPAPVEIAMRFAGGNPAPEIRGEDPLATQSNYYLGDNPSGWVTGVAHDGRVVYDDVWNGIDVVFYGAGSQLEYDFVVAPGADTAHIALSFERAARLEIGAEGALSAVAGGASITQAAPSLYQTVDGARVPVEGRFILQDATTAGVQVGAYDASRILVIDPVTYSTYVGDLLGDGGAEIALDGTGAAYITGTTTSLGFPYAGACSFVCTNGGGFDAFVAKVNPPGNAIVYWTFLGGTGREFGQAIDVDSTGAAYATGWTQSPNFPIFGPVFQPTPPGMLAPFRDDDFVTKLSPAGALVYSTFLGGSRDDEVFDIAVDANGFAYVTGSSASNLNFPTTGGAYDTTYNGGWDVFVTKINQGATAIVWSTWLGGALYDHGQAISVDANGDVYVTGWTLSTNYPAPGAGQLTNAGTTDAFMSRLSSTGAALTCSSYFGGSLTDRGWDIEVDSGPFPRAAWIAGDTTSVNLNVASLFQGLLGGPRDGFVAKFDISQCNRTCSTYLGGLLADEARGIALVASQPQQAWLTGYTSSSTTFPVIVGAVQPVYGGGTRDAFLTRIDCLPNPIGGEDAALAYSSFYGGLGDDVGQDVDTGRLLGSTQPLLAFTGSTSGTFPVSLGAADTTYGGGTSDAWVLVCPNVC